MTGNLTSAEPFDSLDAMKARHKELLRTSEKEISVATVRDRVCEFLARGTATGQVLDDPGERRVAQGLIDYWKATLYTQLRGEIEPAAPCPTTTVLADFPEEDSEKLVANAEGAVVALAPEDQEVARRILQQLVRLDPAVRDYHSVAVSRLALDDVGNVGQVSRVVHALEKAGVVRSSLAPTGEARVELTAAHLVRTWPRYADWLKDRLAFRAAAYLWQQRDRHSSGLVAGLPLAKAAGYRDLDALEGEFLASSRRREAHRQRVWTRGVYAFFTLVILGLALIIGLLIMALVAREGKLESQLQAEYWAKAEAKARQAEADARQSEVLARQDQMLARKDEMLARNAATLAKSEQKDKAARVTNIAAMIRALSDIVVADRTDYEDLARWRWKQLLADLREDREIVQVLELTDVKKALDELNKSYRNDSNAKLDRENQGRAALRIAHAVRNWSLKKEDQTINAMMLTIREDTYATAKWVAARLVEEFKGDWETKKDPDRQGAFEREFWRLYWGPLGMVESNRVEGAMYEFGESLDAIRARFKSPRPEKEEDSIARLIRAHDALIAALNDDLTEKMQPHYSQKR